MSGAPTRQRICGLGELDATGCFEFPLDAHDRETGFVLRHGGAIRAYVNSCAHIGVPLNMTGNNFFDAAREFLICAMHGAWFRPGDGFCVAGPCAGKSLRALPIAVDGGEIWLLDPARRGGP